MDAKIIQEARENLAAKRAEIIGELDRLQTEMRWLGDNQSNEGGSVGNHLADDGSDVMEQERISTVAADLNDVVQQIDRALERIESGSYGTCERCGKLINPERLEAFPYVAYCIECQSHLERQAHLHGAARF